MPVVRFPRSGGAPAVVVAGAVWDRLVATVEMLANTGFAPPMLVDEGPWGRTIRVANPPPGSGLYLAKVTAKTVSGESPFLIKAKKYDAASATLDSTELIVRKAMGHAVNDLIFITQPKGGTDVSLVDTTVVTWLEHWVLSNPVGERYQPVQVIDDNGKAGIDSGHFEL